MLGGEPLRSAKLFMLQDQLPVTARLIKSLFLFGCMLVATPSWSDEPRVLSIGTFYSNENYERTMMGNRARQTYEAIYGRMGLNYQLVENPYLRNLELAANGSIDAVVVFTGDADNDIGTMDSLPESLVLSPVAQSKVAMVVVALKNRATRFDSIQQVKEQKMGILSVMPKAVSYLRREGYNFQRLPSNESGFQMLQAGRLDTLLTSQFVFDRVSKTQGVEAYAEVVYQFGCFSSYMSYSTIALGAELAQEIADKHAKALLELEVEKPGLLIREC